MHRRFVLLLVPVSLLSHYSEGQPPAIAYNIAVTDTTGKSHYEVFTMNADGSGNRNITNHPDVAWTYKARGKDLYFISDRDTCYRCYFLYRTDVNGLWLVVTAATTKVNSNTHAHTI